MEKYVKQTENGAVKQVIKVTPELFEMLVHPSPVVWEESSEEEYNQIQASAGAAGEVASDEVSE